MHVWHLKANLILGYESNSMNHVWDTNDPDNLFFFFFLIAADKELKKLINFIILMVSCDPITYLV